MEINEENQRSELKKRQEIDDVLAELCINAPSTQVKQCLQTYEYGKSLKQLKSAFMTYKLNTLTATYKHIVPVGYLIPKTKEKLTHSIICKVQNYLSDICESCNCSYRFKIQDSPLLECKLCGQEVHRSCFLKSIGEEETSEITALEVLGKINPYNLQNLFYICKPCAKEVVPDDSLNEGVSQQKTSSVANDEPLQSEMVQQNQVSEDSIDNHVTSIVVDTSASPRLNINKTVTVSNRKNDKVCSFYEKGVCKHGRKGDTCKFSHPKMCKKFLTHGYKKGRGCNKKECSDHHPPICKSSLKNGTCFKGNCKKRHVAHTIFQKSKRDGHDHVDSKHEEKGSVHKSDPNNYFLGPMLEKLKEEIAKEIEYKVQSSIQAMHVQMNPLYWQTPRTPPTQTPVGYQQINQYPMGQKRNVPTWNC